MNISKQLQDIIKFISELPVKGDIKIYANSDTVDSNIPANFKLCMPVFKGASPAIFEVETYVNPETLTFQLISPDAVDIIKENRDAIFDVEIELLKELTIIEV